MRTGKVRNYLSEYFPLKHACRTAFYYKAFFHLTYIPLQPSDSKIPSVVRHEKAKISSFHDTENSAKPCDTGTPIEKVAEEFPTIDYTNVDPNWPDKTSPVAGKPYHFTKEAILERGQRALAGLYDRPEKVIVVVSHSGFLRVGVTGSWFFNADYRVFDFVERASEGGAYRLEQRAYTKEKGGGLGRSLLEQVVLGDGLPDEIPEDDE